MPLDICNDMFAGIINN